MKSSEAYYGSYSSDRFGGGIGKRVGINEAAKQRIAGTGVSRVQLLEETHGNLREWATAENWKEATRIHKAAYFTRAANLVQETVLEKIRQHYVSDLNYGPNSKIKAGLFRLEDEAEFQQLCKSRRVEKLPMLIRGAFNEKAERCIVDFANKRLGGGWLSYGMVQEEKMFQERFDYGALCARSLLQMDPIGEPLASPFSMHPDEAWILQGGPAFAHIGWYGWTPANAMEKLKLLNPADDLNTTPTIIAIDAIKASFQVYDEHHLRMMLIKAFTGFVAAKMDPDMGGSDRIATGSWGCGAFHNNERVMFVVQALAANLAGVELAYYVLGDGNRVSEAFEFLEDALLTQKSIDDILQKLAAKCAGAASWKTKCKL